MRTLECLFMDELADMYDAEHRILKALPKLAKAATCEKLKTAFLSHLQETRGHVAKLEQVFQAFGEKAKGKKCEATVGLLKEGDEIAADNKNEPTINAALISAGQKMEHYEIASYGCLQTWALELDNKPAAALLKTILSEEKRRQRKTYKISGLPAATEKPCGSREDQELSVAASDRKRSATLRRARQPTSVAKVVMTSC